VRSIEGVSLSLGAFEKVKRYKASHQFLGRKQPRDANFWICHLGRVITDYKTLVQICRQRADELAISRLEIDRIGGLPSGYAGKLLGKDGGEPGRKNKKIWPIAMEAMLGGSGSRFY
jgi:hypothetical protein